MKNRMRRLLWTGCMGAGLCFTTSIGAPASAWAQAEPSPETTPRPETASPSPPQPFPEEPAPPPPPPPPVVETAPAPPPAPTEDKTKKALTVNAWARVGARLQSFEDPKKLDRLTEDGVFELHADGAITDEIGVTAGLVAGFGPNPTPGGTMSSSAALLDLIGRFDIDDAFHIWLGRMLVPSDRANFSGDWFASPWYYAGSFVSHPLGGPLGGPLQGPNGRNDGATVWGQFGGGLFKYYVGAFDLYSSTKSPLWTARLNLSLISPEPGFYHSSTYYGSKDILAIGIGGQAQKNGSLGPMSEPDDYAEFNADILFEKDLDGGGVITLEGAFYKYDGDNSLDYSYLALASYLTPEKVGAGKLQPLVRLQQLKPQDGASFTSVEAQLGYVIADYAARLALGYQYTKLQGAEGNAIYLGAQFLK